MSAAKSPEKAQRTTQTRARIKRALTELIGEKGFDALTVSDVTRRAGINRGTFYLHFVDKYDLLDQLEDEVISGLSRILLHRGAQATAETALEMFPYEALAEALAYVKQDFDFVQAISGRGGDPEFSDKLKGVIENLLDQGLRRTGSRIDAKGIFLEEYARELVTSHVLVIIDLWLARGGHETPEQVARMICEAKDVSPASLVR